MLTATAEQKFSRFERLRRQRRVKAEESFASGTWTVSTDARRALLPGAFLPLKRWKAIEVSSTAMNGMLRVPLGTRDNAYVSCYTGARADGLGLSSVQGR